MQFNTALCLVLAGAGLCAWNWQRRKWALAAGSLVALVSGLTLYEYLSGIDLRIDQVLFRSYINTETSHAGRMSPVSAFCLLLVGLALILAGIRAIPKWRAVVIGSMGSTVITVCALAMLGYAIDLPGTYGWGQFTRIALHTAAGMMLLGIGLFTVAWNKGRKTEESTPHWLPVPVAIAIIAGSLVFYQALEGRQNQEISQAIMASGEGVRNTISVRIDSRIRSLVRMAQRWEFSGRPTEAAWQNDARNYIQDSPDFQAIEWIDSSNLIRWIEPLAGNEGKLNNQDVTREKRRRTAMDAARESHEPVITRAVELFRGGLGFVVYIPVYKGADFDGWIAGVFKTRSMFDRYLPAPVASGYAISISEGGEVFYERYPSPMPSDVDWTYTSTVVQRGTIWTVRAWPAPALAAKMNSALPKMVSVAGLFFSILMGLSIHLAQNASAQARKTAALNRDLQTALDEVSTLSGLLPICAGCKRIRDDGGYWSQIERYLSNHTDASFSHGICPECALKYYEAEGMEVPEEVLQAFANHQYD